MRRFFRAWAVSTPLLLLLPLTSCQEPPLDTTRQIPERGTFGEEVFALFHNDLLREAPERAQGLELEKAALVESIDQLFPPDELSKAQEFLIKLLPLYDDGTLPAMTRDLAALTERMAAEPAVLEALEALQYRAGYVGLKHEEALLRRIANYPDFKPLTKAFLKMALAQDGRDAEGRLSEEEPDALLRLQKGLAQTLEELELSKDDQRTIVLASQLMLREDVRLAEPGRTPTLIVRRDHRGLARVHRENGRFMAPFADTAPRDGLPDIDNRGKFLTTDGETIEIRPFAEGTDRAPDGRALVNQVPVYSYVDLERTILAGLLRDGRSLIEQDVPMKSLRALDHLLGNRTPEGLYPSANSPLLELLHAAGHAVKPTDLPDLLSLGQTLLSDHMDTTGWNILELEAQLDIIDRYENLNLEADTTLFDDLTVWARKVLAVPGLAEAMVDVLRSPAVAKLPEAGRLMMNYKKERITHEDAVQNRIFVERVDRGQADVANNQSLQQRLFHLIHDTKGAKYTPELIGIPLGFIFEIEDLAEFYILSIIGESSIPGLVSTLTGLSEQPTPEELAEFINEDQTFGNPVGNEGREVRRNDGDTLFAATSSGITDALAPFVRLFYDRDRMDLLFDLLEILHLHWASAEGGTYQNTNRGQPMYSKLSGIRRFEPMLVEILQNTKLVPAVQKLLNETRGLRVSNRSADYLLVATARHIFTVDRELHTRAGNSEVRIDGKRITALSPFDLLRAAAEQVDNRLRTRPSRYTAWQEVTDTLIDLFLETQRTGAESGELKNPRALPITLAVLDFLEGRARHHAQVGDLDSWVRTEMLGHVEDLMTSEELPALIDLLYAIEEDPEINTQIEGLRDELLADDRGFADLLVIAGNSLQALQDQSITISLLNFLGKEMNPEKDLLFRGVDFAQTALELDPDEHVLEVIRRAIEPRPQGGIYAYGIFSAITQAQRNNPLKTQDPTAEDFARVTKKIYQFMLDGEHGLEKFYELVEERTLAGRQAREAREAGRITQ